MRKLLVSGAAAAALVFIAGCASQSTPPPAQPASTAQPAAPANSWTARLAALKTDLEASTKGTGVVIEQTADNQLHVVIPNELSFDTGRANVKRNLAQVLDKVAEGLKSATTASVRVVGHTDNTGSDAYNQELSERRASAVAAYLGTRSVRQDRVTTVGVGEARPVATNDTDAGRQLNRRVELTLVPLTLS